MERISFKESGDELCARLLPEIDHHTAKGMREDIDEMLFKLTPVSLILDFSDVKFMDSSGIGLIIGRAEIAGELGCDVKIFGLSKMLSRIVRLSGIEKIKNITIM